MRAMVDKRPISRHFYFLSANWRSIMMALEVDSLTKTYANGFVALKGLDLQVEAGDFYALLGPNGAGKSTLISIVCSLLNKSAGRVRVFGYDLDTHLIEAKQCIGLVPQEFNFNIFEPLLEVLVNQAGYYGMARKPAFVRAHELLEALGLSEKKTVTARELSGGMKRRLMIARALMHNPKLLLLDEPTAGVDIEIRQSLWQYIRALNEQGTTIILTTHYLEEAEQLCRHIGIISDGKVLENSSMKALLSQLSRETFILDLAEPMESLPLLPGFNLQQLDPNTVSVDMEKGTHISALFKQLGQHNIDITRLHSKTNRLEELFIGIIQNTQGQTHADSN